MQHYLLLIIFTFNFLLTFASTPDSIVNKEVVLINIANLSRDEIAQLILNMEQSNPKVIGLDAWITKEKNDSLLVPVLTQFNNIVLAVKMTDCKNQNCDSLQGQYFPYDKQGHVMVNYVKLKYFPVLKHNKISYPFFSLALLHEYDSLMVAKYLKKKLYKKPFKFYGNLDSFTSMEGRDFLNIPYYRENEITGKIIILGYLGESIGNVKDPETEIDYKLSYLSNHQLPDMFGMVMLANILTDIMIKTK